MPVGKYPGVDSGRPLAAVDDGAPDIGSGFLDGADRAAEDLEGQLVLEERAEEGAVEKLLMDVHVHVLGGEVGGDWGKT